MPAGRGRGRGGRVVRTKKNKKIQVIRHQLLERPSSMPAEEALNNPVILDNILHHVKKSVPPSSFLPRLKELRLVSPSFNQAALRMALATFTLRLDKALLSFYGERRRRTYPSMNAFPIKELEGKLVRNVKMSMPFSYAVRGARKDWYDEDRAGGPTLLSVPAICFINFVKAHGREVMRLELCGVREEEVKPILLAIFKYCLNLKCLQVEVVSRGRVYAQSRIEADVLIPLPRHDNLVSATLRRRSWNECSGSIQMMVQALLVAAPNLASLVINGNVSANLSEGKRLKTLEYHFAIGAEGFTCNDLKQVISSAVAVETLKLDFLWNRGLGFRNEGNFPSPIPNVRTLHFSAALSFGAFLRECIHAMPALRSLTIQSNDETAIQNFFLLIRDSYTDWSLSLQELDFRTTAHLKEDSLAFLPTAFRNLETLKLQNVGKDEGRWSERDGLARVRAVFNPFSHWNRLKTVDLGINFGFQIEHLETIWEEMRPSTWGGGGLKRLAVWLKWRSSVFPFGRYDRNNHIPLEQALLDMKDMDQVTLGNFNMPAGAVLRIGRLIDANNLPVSFHNETAVFSS